MLWFRRGKQHFDTDTVDGEDITCQSRAEFPQQRVRIAEAEAARIGIHTLAGRVDMANGHFPQNAAAALRMVFMGMGQKDGSEFVDIIMQQIWHIDMSTDIK